MNIISKVEVREWECLREKNRMLCDNDDKRDARCDGKRIICGSQQPPYRLNRMIVLSCF